MKTRNTGAPFPTLRDVVYLGRVSQNVRARAKRAGLKVVTAKQYRGLYWSSSALERAFGSGAWYDTVKY